MTNTRANLEVIAAVAAEVRAAMMGDEFDSRTFLDTLDGEVDVMDILGAMILADQEADALIAAAKAVADEYTARKRRLEVRKDAIREGMGKLLDAIGERKVAHSLGTVSRLAARDRVVIVDEAAIPSQLCKSVPDTAAVRAAVMAGEIVPGAEKQSGTESVGVRVK